MLSDRDAVLKVKKGEINAFEHIVKKYSKKVYLFISNRLFNKEEADDLVQNSFIALYKSLDRFDEERPILPYLLQIAQNELKMFYRSHKTTIPLNEKMASSYDLWIDDSKDILTVLNTLSPEQKIILQLRYEGYSYEEIAEKMKRPLNTVRTIIRRAKLQIQKKHEEKH